MEAPLAEASPGGYWAPVQPSIPSTYHEGPGTMGTSAQCVLQDSPEPYGFHRGEHAWSAPTRSMSFGHIEGQSHIGGFHSFLQQDNSDGQSPYTHPPSAHPSSGSFAAGSMSDGTMSAPMGNPAMNDYGFHHSWPSFATPGQPNGVLTHTPEPFTNQWYSEPAPLSKVEEEQPVSGSYGGLPNYHLRPPNPG